MAPVPTKAGGLTSTLSCIFQIIDAWYFVLQLESHTIRALVSSNSVVYLGHLRQLRFWILRGIMITAQQCPSYKLIYTNRNSLVCTISTTISNKLDTYIFVNNLTNIHCRSMKPFAMYFYSPVWHFDFLPFCNFEYLDLIRWAWDKRNDFPWVPSRYFWRRLDHILMENGFIQGAPITQVFPHALVWRQVSLRYILAE